MGLFKVYLQNDGRAQYTCGHITKERFPSEDAAFPMVCPVCAGSDPGDARLHPDDPEPVAAPAAPVLDEAAAEAELAALKAGEETKKLDPVAPEGAPEA